MVKGKKRFGKTSGNYRLEDIWADAEEIGGAIQKMEKNYPQLKDRIFVITEGPYDYEFFSRFFLKEICEIRIANSKNNVIKIIKNVNENSKEKASDLIIGIVDRDFSFFTKSCPMEYSENSDSDCVIENLFMTDTHDIETMIISEELIKKVLDYYRKRSAGGDFQRSMLSSIRENDTLTQLIRCCRLLGLCLFVNEKYGLNMTFKHINCKKKNVFTEFTDTFEITFDEDKFLALIKKRNTEIYEEFKNLLSAELSGDTDYFSHPMHICRGHDLMCVLLAEINANYPSADGQKVRSRDLERIFRNFYDEKNFYNTDIFIKISEWAENKKPVLKDRIFISSSA